MDEKLERLVIANRFAKTKLYMRERERAIAEAEIGVAEMRRDEAGGRVAEAIRDLRVLRDQLDDMIGGGRDG